MSREQRRRLLLRAWSAAKRFTKKAEKDVYFSPASDAFVAGWLLGYRACRRDLLAFVRARHEQQEYTAYIARQFNPPDEGPTGDDNEPTAD